MRRKIMYATSPATSLQVMLSQWFACMEDLNNQSGGYQYSEPFLTGYLEMQIHSRPNPKSHRQLL